MTSREVAIALQSRIPVHFYGPGLGKSTITAKLRELGFVQISEAGDSDICGSKGCYSIPKDFSGLLVFFKDTPAEGNLPELFQLLNTKV